MEVGAEVWLRDVHGDQAWIPASITAKTPVGDGVHFQIVAHTDEGEVFTSKLREDDEDSEVKLRNLESDAAVENLINLPYLHEPAILCCLQERYNVGDIYTYTGPILIALNPFQQLPLYSDETLHSVYSTGLLRSQGIELDSKNVPHVYAIADAAYRDMMQVLLSKFSLSSNKSTSTTTNKSTTNVGNKSSIGRTMQSADQSILISGESGAGKTESTKFVLRYLTTVGREDKNQIFSSTTSTSSSITIDNTTTTSVMDKILQSNPILEAFGNARTLRNDNSSRFGKFIILNFDRLGVLTGGSIKTYLLEKVRLPRQQERERNFHIFYQMMYGSNDIEKKLWKLPNLEDANYTCHGGIYTLRNIDDHEEYQKLKLAMKILDFTQIEMDSIFQVIAGILHLGQLEFESLWNDEGEGNQLLQSSLEENMNSLKIICELFQIDSNLLLETFHHRIIIARGETYIKKLTALQAIDARDAISKAIYGKLFDWLVVKINQGIYTDATRIHANISVLDIFGFESFAYNSFEQLCINYTNETLQQQFNQYIFQMEQVEYQKEAIEWSFIAFPDNKETLDLIENRVNGILSMLDDECRLPGASDEKFASRLYRAFEKHNCFSVSAPQRRDFQFSIRHYAGSVVYNTRTFVEKNKDELPKEVDTLMQSSKLPLLRELFTAKPTTTSNVTTTSTSNAPGRRRASVDGNSSSISAMSSVGSQFKEQLTRLMETIYSTSPHYIRCLKPNDQNVPAVFDRLRITEQLRYGGVLEAVRVARSGFPVRLSHTDFYNAYRLLIFARDESLKKQLPRYLQHYKGKETPKELCERLIAEIWDSLGLTTSPVPGNKKLPRKTPVFAVHLREDLSTESIQLGLTKIFLRKRAHDVLGACKYRRIIGALTKIQATWKSFTQRNVYRTTRAASIMVQKIIRRFIATRRVYHLRQKTAATKIQTAWRKMTSMIRYCRFKHSLVVLQSAYRCRPVYKTYHRYRHALIVLQRRWKAYYAAAFAALLAARRAEEAAAAAELEAQNQAALAAEALAREKAALVEKELKEAEELERKQAAAAAALELEKVKLAEKKAAEEAISVAVAAATAAAAEEQKAVHAAALAATDARLVELMAALEAEKVARLEAENQARMSLGRFPLYGSQDGMDNHVAPLAPLAPVLPMGQQPPEMYDPMSRRYSMESDYGNYTGGSYNDRRASLESTSSATVVSPPLPSRVSDYLVPIASLPPDLATALAEKKEMSAEISRLRALLQSGGLSNSAIRTPSMVRSPTHELEDVNEDDEDGLDAFSSRESTPAKPTHHSQELTALLEAWTRECSQGITCLFTESRFGLSDVPVTLKLNAACDGLQFISQSKRTAWPLLSAVTRGTVNASSPKIAPLPLADVIQAEPSEIFDQNSLRQHYCLHLDALPAGGQHLLTGRSSPTPRTVCLSFLSMETRDLLFRRILALSAASKPYIEPAGGIATKTNRLSMLRRTSTSPLKKMDVQQATRRATAVQAIVESKLQENHKERRKDISQDRLRELQTQCEQLSLRDQRMTTQIALLSRDLDNRDEELKRLRQENEKLTRDLTKRSDQLRNESATLVLVTKRLEQLLLGKAEAEHHAISLQSQLESVRQTLHHQHR